MKIYCRLSSFVSAALLVAAVSLLTGVEASAQKKIQISATSMGTSSQMGQIFNVDLHINQISTDADQRALIEAFQAGGSEGLANALEKMSAKGRMAITGTLGFDVNYIKEFKLPDGTRRIRMVTDRPVKFGELWGSTRSLDYTISIVEIDIKKDKGKSTGTLLPASRVKLNKEGEIEVEALQNPWRLQNIKVW